MMKRQARPGSVKIAPATGSAGPSARPDPARRWRYARLGLRKLTRGNALLELLRRELQRLGVLPGGLTDHLPLLRGQLDADRLFAGHGSSSRKGALSRCVRGVNPA